MLNLIKLIIEQQRLLDVSHLKFIKSNSQVNGGSSLNNGANEQG